jgi:rRNA maturation RNase YbeY
MILFFSETNFKFSSKKPVKDWLGKIITNQNKKQGDINIVFYDDEKLSEFNKTYLKHNTLTDIITFDYSENGLLGGDICISVERVKENAQKFNCSFDEELRRVMAHGVLHLCGYGDRSRADKLLMKQKEEEALFLFNTHYN